MNAMSQPDWQPDPQLLAAYFDGELTGADAATLRIRIENWLEAHPEASADWAELKKLLRDTAPSEPSESAWRSVRERMDAKRPAPPPKRRPWLAAAAIAAGIALFLGTIVGWRALRSPQAERAQAVLPGHPDEADFEPLPVASADEVTILRIEGADTDAVPVAFLPVAGELELAGPGEVCISCKCPRINVRQDPPHRPMIWARAD